MSVEILAPAGSIDHLRYAVCGGADGVYLGTKEFSARQNALNFTFDQLEEAVKYCHIRDVKVYVAVNTLIKNGELEKLYILAEQLGEINVDGVIIQDLAVAEIFKKVCPEMPLHASTQMAIHNLSGAETARELGFSRVVLARELTFKEIKEITSKCQIETEVFVHGAHCMSVSGMCYLSSFIGGRSGNRGRCAQPCRLDFKAGGNGYCLSLKDMCYIDHVKKLEDVGVSSLKIEGRMKRPEYAYIASKTYKKALKCENTDEEMRILKGIFSRSGFTDGYIMGKRDGQMFGYRQKEDVQASSEAIKALGRIEETNKIPISVDVSIKEGERINAKFSCEKTSVEVFSENEVTSSTKLPPAERIEASFRKTGDTPFVLNDFQLKVDVKDGQKEESFPISAFNSLRRNGLEKIAEKISFRKKKKILSYRFQGAVSLDRNCTEYRIRVEKAEQIGDFSGTVILPYMEAERLPEKFDVKKIVLELPILVYPEDEKPLMKKLESLKEKGFENIICENISFVSKCRKMGFVISAGAFLNITNKVSAEEYKKMGISDFTLSPEINSGELRFFDGEYKIGIISYGKLPLMQFRNCPIKANVGCEKCGGNFSLKDRLSKNFQVSCKKKYVSLLNTVPISLSGTTLSVDFQTLYFTKETPLEVKKIIDEFKSGIISQRPHTKGLYFRKVL